MLPGAAFAAEPAAVDSGAAQTLDSGKPILRNAAPRAAAGTTFTANIMVGGKPILTEFNVLTSNTAEMGTHTSELMKAS